MTHQVHPQAFHPSTSRAATTNMASNSITADFNPPRPRHHNDRQAPRYEANAKESPTVPIRLPILILIIAITA